MWEIVRWFFGFPKCMEPRKSFWDEAMDLGPGQVCVVTDHKSGNQYALMHLDDLDHIAGLSRLQRRELSVQPSHEDQP